MTTVQADRHDELVNMYSAFRVVTEELMFDTLPGQPGYFFPLHKGSERYYKEKGILK